MKKAFLFGFKAIFFAWIITNVTYSQGSISISKLKSQPPTQKKVQVTKQLNASGNSHLFLRNEISIKAVRHFIREHQTISDAKWYKSPDGEFSVYFISENMRCVIYYNKKGTYQWMIRHYNEDKLPREVRHLVRRNYYDFDISYVSEISRNGKTCYAIRIEDRVSWKTIKVEDDVIEVVEEYFKAEGTHEHTQISLDTERSTVAGGTLI